MKNFSLGVAALLLSCCSLWAQNRYQEVRIGEKCPDIRLSPILNYYRSSARISDFRGKVLILDFWATWCSPCVALLPVNDSLQQEFGKRICILGVCYQPTRVVGSFLTEMNKFRKVHPITLTSDTILEKIFPHTYLPHVVWIDPKGIVRSITEGNQITAAHIESFLRDGSLRLPLKKNFRIPYDLNQALLIGGNGGHGAGIRYQSMLFRYQPGLPPSWKFEPGNRSRGSRLTAINLSCLDLFRIAWGARGSELPRSRVRVMVRDPAALQSFPEGPKLSWSIHNTYGFLLDIPPEWNGQFFTLFRNEMRHVFPWYRVEWKMEWDSCLILVRTPAWKGLPRSQGPASCSGNTKGYRIRNHTLHWLVHFLETHYRLNIPLVDQTHYSLRIDLEIPSRESGLNCLNKSLAPLGLNLRPGRKALKRLLIRDRARPQQAWEDAGESKNPQPPTK